MKRLIKSLCLVLVLVLVLSACGKKGLVGTWTYSEGGYVYTFNEDGTGNYAYGEAKMEFTYTTDGDKLSILYNGNTSPFETTYVIDGNTLTIKDSFGNDTVYKK